MKFPKKTKSCETVEEKEHKYDLFPDLLNNFTKRRVVDDTDNPAMAFIMARFLSMCADGFDAAATYNDVSLKLPDWARRLVIFHLTPQMSRPPFMKYVGKAKEKENPKALLIIAKIEDHFKCRRHHAVEIYNLLKQQKQRPGRFFGLDDERAKG